MTTCAHFICILADVLDSAATSPAPNPDDLLVLLAVSRTGRFTSAAESLGLNHTTVSRRIAALEKTLAGRVLSRTVGGWELTELGRRAVLAAEDQLKRGCPPHPARASPSAWPGRHAR